MDCSRPGLPVHHQLLEFTQTHVYRVVMPSNHIILCRPLLLPPSIFPSIRVFSKESALHIRWPECWEFQLQHQSSQGTFRTDFLLDGLVGSPCCPKSYKTHLIVHLQEPHFTLCKFHLSEWVNLITSPFFP